MRQLLCSQIGSEAVKAAIPPMSVMFARVRTTEFGVEKHQPRARRANGSDAFCASTSREMSPAPSSTFKYREMAGSEISNGAVIKDAEAYPARS